MAVQSRSAMASGMRTCAFALACASWLFLGGINGHDAGTPPELISPCYCLHATILRYMTRRCRCSRGDGRKILWASLGLGYLLHNEGSNKGSIRVSQPITPDQ